MAKSRLSDERPGVAELRIAAVGAEEGHQFVKVMIDLQMKMATSSMNHEYARMEFDDTACVERREELLEYMQECRDQYFEARDHMANFDPYALQEFERELMKQKQQVFVQHNA